MSRTLVAPTTAAEKATVRSVHRTIKPAGGLHHEEDARGSAGRFADCAIDG